MAGKTKIGIGTIGLSQAQAAGWKLVTNAINKESHYGIFTQEGVPFYVGLVEYDNKIGIFNHLPSLGDFTPKGLDPFTVGDKSGVNKNLAECGVIAFNYTINNPITTAPVEEGGLISVNKVKTPIQGQVTYVSTGTEKQRSYFERALQQASASLQTFYLSTPAYKLKRINITGYSISQTSEAAGQMFRYLVSFTEVMQTAKITPLEHARPFSGTGQNAGALEFQDASGTQQQAARKSS